MRRKLSFEKVEGRLMMSGTKVEAEDMVLVSGFRAHERAGASGGEYISVRTDNFGEAKTAISVPAAGEYSLAITVKAASGDKNEIAFSIDGGPRQSWVFPTSNKYVTHTWGQKLNLTAGSHTIRIFGVEAGTQIDAIELTGGPVSPPPAGTPGQNFDLSRWKLDIPVTASGGTSGVGQTIFQPELETYESDYFKTAADGAMQFYAPVVGAKTSTNTSYTRSELREMNLDGSKASWKTSEDSALQATVAVNQMPVADGGKVARIVVGQIHGPDDELCRLYYDANGKVYYINDKSTGGKELTHELKSASGQVSAIPLNAKFDYKITVANNTLTVMVTHDGVSYSYSEPINSFWSGKGMYFKAGSYNGVGAPGSGAGTLGSGASRVSFYNLEISH